MIYNKTRIYYINEEIYCKNAQKVIEIGRRLWYHLYDSLQLAGVH